MGDSWWSAVAEVRRRAVHPPFVTTAVIASVLFTALRYRTLQQDLPLSIAFRYGYSGRALSMGHWSTLLTSQLLSRNAFMTISIVLSLALLLGLYEAISGSIRALIVTVVGAVSGPVLVAAALGVGSSLGNPFAGRTLSTLDYGCSTVTAAAGGALVAVLGLRRLRWFAVMWVLGGLIVHHQIADWEHLGCFAVGFGLGWVLGVTAHASDDADRTPRSAHRVPLHRWVAVGSSVMVGAVTGALFAGVAVPAPGLIIRAVALPTRGSHGEVTRVALTAPAVEQVSYPAPSLGATRTAFVVLPPGYDQSRRRYPVVELLHGYPGSPNDIITGLDPVGAELLPGMPPFIAVAPDGRGPVVEDSWFSDTPRQRVGTAVSDDLRAYIDHTYRTNGAWNVGGLSAGGYGAAYLGARKPGQYHAVCSMSGEFIPKSPAFSGARRSKLVADSPVSHTSRGGPATLLIAGASDPTSLRQSTEYARRLQHSGQPHQLVVVPGTHEWSVWKRALPACLRYMLSPAPRWTQASDPRAAPSKPRLDADARVQS